MQHGRGAGLGAQHAEDLLKRGIVQGPATHRKVVVVHAESLDLGGFVEGALFHRVAQVDHGRDTGLCGRFQVRQRGLARRDQPGERFRAIDQAWQRGKR